MSKRHIEISHIDYTGLEERVLARIEDPELGIKCVDGAVCHHKCDNRCFRRDCCVPLSGYVGPWEYPDETN